MAAALLQRSLPDLHLTCVTPPPPPHTHTNPTHPHPLSFCLQILLVRTAAPLPCPTHTCHTPLTPLPLPCHQILLVRALYTQVRVLPAYRIFRACKVRGEGGAAAACVSKTRIVVVCAYCTLCSTAACLHSNKAPGHRESPQHRGSWHGTYINQTMH
jgi:hypothetical protein